MISAPQQRKVTIIYYCNHGLTLHYTVEILEQNAEGRVIIPKAFKEGKSIVAVCDGEVKILNTLGDGILSAHYLT